MNLVLYIVLLVEFICNVMCLDLENKLVILFDEFEKVCLVINSNNRELVIDFVWDIYEW